MRTVYLVEALAQWKEWRVIVKKISVRLTVHFTIPPQLSLPRRTAIYSLRKNCKPPPSPHHRNLVIVSANIPFKNIGQIVDLILRNNAQMTDAKLLTVNVGCYCFFIYWNLFCIALQMDLIISFQNRQESTIWPELCIHSRNIFVHIIIIFENKSTGIDYCIVYTLKNYKLASRVLVVVSFSVNVLAYCFGEFKVP